MIQMIDWFGDTGIPLIVVDTPGCDDIAMATVEEADSRNKLRELSTDMHDKLNRMGHIDLVLVVHNDIVSNRLNSATFTVLKMMIEKFSLAEQSIWNNLAVVYSKCNESESIWKKLLVLLLLVLLS